MTCFCLVFNVLHVTLAECSYNISSYFSFVKSFFNFFSLFFFFIRALFLPASKKPLHLLFLYMQNLPSSSSLRIMNDTTVIFHVIIISYCSHCSPLLLEWTDIFTSLHNISPSAKSQSSIQERDASYIPISHPPSLSYPYHKKRAFSKALQSAYHKKKHKKKELAACYCGPCGLSSPL